MSDKKKALFIGGTGTISLSIVRRLVTLGWDVWTLNRGSRSDVLPEEVHQIHANAYNENETAEAIKGLQFDTVCEFIAYSVPDVERDIRLFSGITRQYIFISSASAYQKPCVSPYITEDTPLDNPYWEYSRNKQACEQRLFEEYRTNGFPVTVVRPSHTYDERKIPIAIHGRNGSWQTVKRMREGKKVLVPGDGKTLWTLTWCEDFAIGFTGLMGKKEALGEAFQITGDESLTWDQILSLVAGATGGVYRPCHVPSDLLGEVGRKYGYDYTGELLGDKANTVIFKNDKLKKLVPEMETRVPFSEGVKRCAERILSDPSLQKEDPDFDAFTDRVVEAMEKVKSLI